MVLLTTSDSSLIAAHGYEPVSRVLAIRFQKSPHVHLFQDVDQEVADSRHGAESLGKWFNGAIRGKFNHTTVKADDDVAAEQST